MQSAADRQAINHYLAKYGLGSLNDPGLAAALGYLIGDDAELSRLLNCCEPGERRSMYEALRPNLRFPARRLDEYVSEWREQAEVRQLPIVGEDGTMRAYNVPEVKTALDKALVEAVAKYHLIVTCRRCTWEETFAGTDRYEAVKRARESGWVYYHGEESVGFEVCPKCAEDYNP